MQEMAARSECVLIWEGGFPRKKGIHEKGLRRGFTKIKFHFPGVHKKGGFT